MIRPWHRIGHWSPEEAAQELHRRRPELVGQLRRRSESRAVPLDAQEEIVDDATTAVVMSPRGIVNEHHLLGAFWLAVDHRCRRYREGRHFARLGSRVRVEFDVALAQATGSVNPFDRLELRDRFARAADLMADLSPREREVVSAMATYGVGPIPTARLLHVPLGEVRSAARSASAKLDRVAAIAAAGRLCEFRFRAIAADAAGQASDREARRARAHIQACAPCCIGGVPSPTRGVIGARWEFREDRNMARTASQLYPARRRRANGRGAWRRRSRQGRGRRDRHRGGRGRAYRPYRPRNNCTDAPAAPRAYQVARGRTGWPGEDTARSSRGGSYVKPGCRLIKTRAGSSHVAGPA
jgi:DNA-directed RNA polymerase specialized sigma24 family protein